ncbi:MAG: urea carboxylase-associated family protein [Pseudomonadota bacterium]|nr:urea carboxylase-associated family protein [Pseudomonadota bacterium]
MMSNEILTIPARKGVAAAVHAGHSVHVINTHGQQVVDTWAFNADDISEFMSMEHSRAAFRRANPRTGDTYVTNRRRPILHVAEDTSPGIHDTLIAACDPYRYEQLGHVGHHDNCTENLHAALSKLGREATETPSPLNLFMNIEIKADGDLEWLPPVSKPGDTIILRVEMDCVVVFSACPMDLLPINGVDNEPTEAHFKICAPHKSAP